MTTTTAVDEATLSQRCSFCKSSWGLHFLAGSGIGITCFYIMDSVVIPLMPHMTNVVADGALSAVVWGVITTSVAFSLWIGFALVSQTFTSKNIENIDNDNHNEKRASETIGDYEVNTNDADENSTTEAYLYWEEKEYFYSLGVLLGFNAACIVSLATKRAPSIFLVALLTMALAWIRVMSWIRVFHLHNKESAKEILPTVHV